MKERVSLLRGMQECMLTQEKQESEKKEDEGSVWEKDGMVKHP